MTVGFGFSKKILINQSQKQNKNQETHLTLFWLHPQFTFKGYLKMLKDLFYYRDV